MKGKKVTALSIAAALMMSGVPVFASQYADMPSGWSKAAVEYALDKGYIRGYDGKLDPTGLITRAQAAAIVERALSLTEKTDISAYTDADKNAWYYESMEKVAAAGILKGYGDMLRPEDNITREECMAIIARAYKTADGNSDLSAFADGGDVSDWAKAAVSGLVGAGIVSGDGEKLNPKSSITREEFVQLIYNCETKLNKSDKSDKPEQTAAPEATAAPTQQSPSPSPTPTSTPKVTRSGGGGGGSSSSLTKYALDKKGEQLTADGVEYMVAELDKAMSKYSFTYNGKTVKPTAVNAEKTIVKYPLSDVDLDEKLYAKTFMTYGEYWYTETSDGYTGEQTTAFAKDAKAEQIPDYYTAAQSGEDKYAAAGADNDAGMYDEVSRATVGYGLGRSSFKQSVTAKTTSGEEKEFSSSIEYADSEYKIIRPETAAEEFGYNAASNRGSGGAFVLHGYKDVVVSVSKDMLVNAELLKETDGYSEQAQAVLDKASALEFDESLTLENVYAGKELLSNGLFGKRTVNEKAAVKDIGAYSEANTTADNTFTVNTKYGRRYGDVTFLIYFDNFKDMKAQSGYDKANINGDDKTAGAVGEFKNYVYNVTRAKIEYLGADGKSKPVVAGAKFGEDIWISPNHGPVVEIAVTNSYDRFKAFGDGVYKITLMADGYKDVVFETSAVFGVSDPLKMQGESDDVEEIKDGVDLVLKYDVINMNYVENLKKAIENGTADITITEGKTTAAKGGKLEVNGSVLTVTFENVKDKLAKDTQYAVVFPTLDYNDVDKLGMNASIHYAPADAQTVELTEKVEINGAEYFYTAEKAGKYMVNGTEVSVSSIGDTGVVYYSAAPLSGTLYTTVNMPYADFYYAELNNVKENAQTTPDIKANESDTMKLYRSEGYYDAVSCATTTKSKRYPASNTIVETGTDGAEKVTIDGIKDVPVAIAAQLYAEACILNASGISESSENGILSQVKRVESVTAQQPQSYKTLYADGTYSALNAQPEAADGTGAALETGIPWGDYELVLPAAAAETVTTDNLAAAIIFTDDGSYAMRHSQNTWLKTNMMAWSIGVRTTEPHGNTLAYKAYEDMSGKTIKSVRYILNNGGVFTAVDYAVDLKVKHLLAKAGDGLGIKADGKDLGESETTVSFEKKLPSDSAYTLTSLTCSGAPVEYTASGDDITLSGEFNKGGTYTALFTDDKYENVSVSFKITDTSLTAEMLTISDGAIVISEEAGITAAQYAAAITSVKVNDGTAEKEYKVSGKGAVKLVDADGKIIADAASGGKPVFAEGAEYTLTFVTSSYSDISAVYTR